MDTAERAIAGDPEAVEQDKRDLADVINGTADETDGALYTEELDDDAPEAAQTPEQAAEAARGFAIHETAANANAAAFDLPDEEAPAPAAPEAPAEPEAPQDAAPPAQAEQGAGEAAGAAPAESAPVLSGDEMRRDNLPGYDPADWRTHIDRSGIVARKMEERFQELLRTRKGKGNGEVVFLAGGNGVGKSTFAGELGGTPDFIIDSTLGNLSLVRKQIEAILANGQSPIVDFVYRTPEQALDAIQGRVKNGGHAVSPLSFADSHTKSLRNLGLLAQEYGNRIEIHIVDNSVEGAPEITLEQLEAKGIPNHEDIRKRANEVLGRAQGTLVGDTGAPGAGESGGGSEGAQEDIRKRANEVLGKAQGALDGAPGKVGIRKGGGRGAEAEGGEGRADATAPEQSPVREESSSVPQTKREALLARAETAPGPRTVETVTAEMDALRREIRDIAKNGTKERYDEAFRRLQALDAERELLQDAIDGSLSGKKAKELRNLARKLGLSPAGDKAHLIERIRKARAEHGDAWQAATDHDAKEGTELTGLLRDIASGTIGTTHRHYKVANSSNLLKAHGVSGDYFTIRSGVITRHAKKEGHTISAEEWVDIARNLGSPFAITRYTKKEGANNYRL